MNLDKDRYLFTITDRFRLEGRGMVLLPGIPWTEGTPVVRKGDPLILRTPLGEILRTTVQDLEMIDCRPGGERLEATPLSLPKDLHPFDIPIGTEVYLDPATADSPGKGRTDEGTGDPPPC